MDPEVAGSKPVTHPILFSLNTQSSRRQPFSIIELSSSNGTKNLLAYSFLRSKTKSVRFARSIRVNRFDSLLYLIRFMCEITWVIPDPSLLDTPSVREDKWFSMTLAV